MSISDMSQLYIFTRKRIDTSKLFLMVVFPTDQFSPYVIQQTLNFLKKEVSKNIFEYFSINGDQFGRIHVYFDMPNCSNWYPNTEELENGLRQIIRPWEDSLKEALQEEYLPENAEKLYEKYVHAFPKHHKVRRTGKQTLVDICFFEKVFQLEL